MRIENPRTSPTDVIASWIPHDARWHEQARASAVTSTDAVREYVTGLVTHHRDGDQPLDDEFDLRSIAAVVEDLGVHGLGDVHWTVVRDALLIPLRVLGR
jgi:hypothetical protein